MSAVSPPDFWEVSGLFDSDGTLAPGARPEHRQDLATEVRQLGWLSLWVPKTRFTSCDLLVFVEEAAESVVPLDGLITWFGRARDGAERARRR